jgi:hypothetical protein
MKVLALLCVAVLLLVSVAEASHLHANGPDARCTVCAAGHAPKMAAKLAAPVPVRVLVRVSQTASKVALAIGAFDAYSIRPPPVSPSSL